MWHIRRPENPILHGHGHRIRDRWPPGPISSRPFIVASAKPPKPPKPHANPTNQCKRHCCARRSSQAGVVLWGNTASWPRHAARHTAQPLNHSTSRFSPRYTIRSCHPIQSEGSRYLSATSALASNGQRCISAPHFRWQRTRHRSQPAPHRAAAHPLKRLCMWRIELCIRNRQISALATALR